MLTLAGSFHVDGGTVFRDVERRDDRWQTTSTFYVVADRPRLARDNDGVTAIDFLRYRRDAGTAGASGGVLVVTIDLRAPADPQTIRQAIASALGPEAPPDIALGALPLVGGRVDFAFAGGTDGDLARAVGGAGPARLTGREQATFVVDLTTDGATLLHQAIERGDAVLHARYTLDVTHILGDIELRVWCDARGAHRLAAARSAAGPLDPTSLRGVLVGEHIAGYELVTEQPIEPAARQRLDDLGAVLLDRVIGEAFVDAAGHPRPWRDGLPSLVNRTYRESIPIVTPLVIEDALAIDGPLPADRLRVVDLDGGRSRVLDVTLFCTLGDEDDLVETVKASVHYTRLGVETRTEAVFDRQRTSARIRADLGAPSERTYRLEALVYYRGNPTPAHLRFPPDDRAVAVLDVDGLGVLRVALALGDVPFDRIRTVTVELAHDAAPAPATFVLDRDHPRGLWRIVIGDRPRAWRHRVTWTLADDTRVQEPWTESDAAGLTLHAPDQLRAITRVQLISAGPFDGVAQIALELRASSDDDSPDHRVFSAPGQQQEWIVGRAPGATVSYDVRDTVVYADGHVVRREWRREDAPVLVVRDPGQFVVRILPRLLALGADVPLALLAIEPVDAAGAPVDRTTLTLRDGADARWSFRVRAPDHHRYRYQLTLVPRSGQRTVLPWQEADDEVLVLRPPA